MTRNVVVSSPGMWMPSGMSSTSIQVYSSGVRTADPFAGNTATLTRFFHVYGKRSNHPRNRHSVGRVRPSSLATAKPQLKRKKCTTISSRRTKFNVELLSGKRTTREFELAHSMQYNALNTEEEDSYTLNGNTSRSCGQRLAKKH
ncbi:hypothetical protein LSAT2_018644, partial [Lamellibrachia satsuma]